MPAVDRFWRRRPRENAAPCGTVGGGSLDGPREGGVRWLSAYRKPPGGHAIQGSARSQEEVPRSPPLVTREVARRVRQLAQDRCEYCHLPASVYPLPFHADHIVARQHGGQTVLENLALACLHCHRHQGPNIAGTDSDTGEIVRLFHPRSDRWNDHFEWAGAALTGRTTI